MSTASAVESSPPAPRPAEVDTSTLRRDAGVTVLFLAAAIVVRVTLDTWVGGEAVFLPFGVAVLLAAWHGGRVAGLATALLSAAVAAFVFLNPTSDAELSGSAAQLVWFLAFAATGVATTWVVESIRQSRRDAVAARAEPSADARRAGTETSYLSLLLESIAEYAIFMLDTDGNVVSWNAGARRAKGYADDEIIGSHFSVFYPEEDRRAGKPERALRRALEEGSYEDQGWRVRADGSRFWANVTLTPIYANGELRGFAKVTRDMTQRRTADTLLKSVLDSAIDGILGIDERGTIRSFNAAAERMFLYRADAVVGQPVGMLMPEPHRSRYTEFLTRYLAAGDRRPLRRPRQLEGVRSDGSRFPLELTVSEFTLEGRRYFTAVVRDVTHQRALEEQLQQAQKMQAVGQLAGGIAHDFNNVLTIISGHTELLLTRYREGALHGALVEIRDASGRAAALTRQLLAFSRRAVVDPKVVDLNSIVLDADRMLRRIIGEDIELVTHLAPELRRVSIDQGQIGQVLMNLCVNARDAMPHGGRLVIETQNLEVVAENGALRPGTYVVLRVRDNGCGMPPDVARRIFEPFFTTKQPGEGTGLGLSVVYGILKQSGGSVDVKTAPGAGAEFQIVLPASHAPAPVARARPAREYVPSGDETLLVVEDEESVRRLAVLSLRSHGYNVLEASNGSEALRVLAELGRPVDMVVTDIVMPVMGGRQLVEAIRSTDEKMKVLYVSGYTDDAVVRHGVRHADVSFLQKPYTPNALAAKVRNVLDGTD